MSVLFGQVVRGMTAGTRVFEYLEMRPTMKLIGGRKIPKANIKGNISLKNIKFTYPCRPDQLVLDNLTLDVQAGKVTALCGSSGSGTHNNCLLVTHLKLIQKFFFNKIILRE